MAKERNIVAAELLSVKDKVSLLDAIAFPVAGDHIAGLAGALVGASLVPSKLIYAWRVLYDDGSYGKLKFDGTDPRNNLLMDMPYLPDYEACMESEDAMNYQGIGEQLQDSAPATKGSTAPNVAQQASYEPVKATNTSVVIGAGYYEFGGNFPEGVFNLEYVSGEGDLQLKDKDGWLSDISFGQSGGATSYSGLSSNEYKSFKLDGGVQLKVIRASMIQI